MVTKCWRESPVVVSLERIINILLVGLTFVISIFGSCLYWSYKDSLKIEKEMALLAIRKLAPVKYLSIAVLTRTVYPGEPLRVRVTFDRRRNCPGEFDRSIMQYDQATGEDTLIYRDKVSNVATPIGEGLNYTFKMPTPKDIPPGSYIYSQIGRLDCDGNIFSIEAPTASFRVCALDDIACKD